MNIIISSLDEIRVTGSNTDIDSLKIFISKAINEQDALEVSVYNDAGEWPIEKTISTSLEKQEYYGYLTSVISHIPNGNYFISISGSKTDIALEITDSSSLVDEHDPVLIIGRRINPISTTILAQDANSQQITFYLKKKYDGISVLDENKHVYIDFIPLDPTDLPENADFISDEIKDIIYEDVIAPKGQSGEWVVLKWNVPYAVTKLAGNVTFALSIVDPTNNRYYTWQTLTSSLQISKNIGFRQQMNMTEEEESIFAELSDRVSDIESFIGYQADDNADNDEEIVVEGGNASTVVKEGAND